MILPGFPIFFVGGAAGDNLTAGTWTFGNIVGYSSSSIRSTFGDPGPDIGALSPVPDTSKTWLLLGDSSGSLGMFLAGDQTGYMAGKTLTIDSDAYTAASPGYGENYDSTFDFTTFGWTTMTPLVSGNTYLVTIT